MTDLRRAFLHWLSERPPTPRSKCCEKTHFGSGWTPLPDVLVCTRELAWRVYVRIRDGNKDYPFKRSPFQ